MHRAIAIGVAACLAACGPKYSKLDVDKIQTVTVTSDVEAFCAYAPVAVRALVTYKDGKQVQTQVPGEDAKGRLRTSEFTFSANHGTVDSNAILTLSPDPLAWFDEPIEVNANVAARPTVGGAGELRPRFDCGGTLDLRGDVGARGGEAEDGGPGAPGPSVEVALTYVDTRRSGRLVLLRARRGDEAPEWFLILPNRSMKPFVVDARGGAGGGGGQGIEGYAGRPGLDGRPGFPGAKCTAGTPGEPGTEGEPGGPGSPGMNGGPGGPGGHVTVRYDARFPELETAVQVIVYGGDGGAQGPGGAGGRGGRGGTGGEGGGAGSTPPPAPDGSLPPECNVDAGARGADGPAGAQGQRGADGLRGEVGPDGDVVKSAADVTAIFADEIARGLPIVVDAGGQP